VADVENFPELPSHIIERTRFLARNLVSESTSDNETNPDKWRYPESTKDEVQSRESKN
jgi:hypothetical protein